MFCSIVPFPNPIPDQEWRVFALQFNKTAAQPVRAQTWISFLEYSFIFLINADFPEPPGPVINILYPLIYLSNANCCKYIRGYNIYIYQMLIVVLLKVPLL